MLFKVNAALLFNRCDDLRHPFPVRTCSDPMKTCSCYKEESSMRVTMGHSIKRKAARRKAALVVDLIQGKTTVAETSRAHDVSPSNIVTGNLPRK